MQPRDASYLLDILKAAQLTSLAWIKSILIVI